MKKIYLFVLIVALMMLTVPALGEGSNSIQFTDGLGRSVSLDKPADQIGFSGYGVAEAIKLIGAWDKVTARDGYISDDRFYPNLDTIPAISVPNGIFDLNYEKILEIKPEVIILPVSRNTKQETIQSVIDTLEPEIPVVFLDFSDPETFDDNIKKLGQICGEEEGAKRYLKFYDEIISTIKDKTSSMSADEKPAVFMKAAGYTPDQLCSYGKEADLWNQMCSISGGSSISADFPSAWTEIDPEWLVGKDIDIIIGECWDSFYPESFGYAATNPSGKKKAAEAIITNISSMDIFSQSNAVKDTKIYLIHDPLTNTPRFVVGIAYLAKWFHPDLFTNLDPKQIHQQYLTDFIGSDYNLDETGLSAYP